MRRNWFGVVLCIILFSPIEGIGRRALQENETGAFESYASIYEYFFGPKTFSVCMSCPDHCDDYGHCIIEARLPFNVTTIPPKNLEEEKKPCNACFPCEACCILKQCEDELICIQHFSGKKCKKPDSVWQMPITLTLSGICEALFRFRM